MDMPRKRKTVASQVAARGPLPELPEELISELVKGVVTVETEDGHGSGFAITNDGYLLTNAHVVGDAAAVKVKFQQGLV